MEHITAQMVLFRNNPTFHPKSTKSKKYQTEKIKILIKDYVMSSRKQSNKSLNHLSDPISTLESEHMVSSIKKLRLLFVDSYFESSIVRYVVDRAFYARFIYWKYKIQTRGDLKIPNTNNVHWVSPERIRYLSLERFNVSSDKQIIKVVPGNWDRFQEKVGDSTKYQTTREKFTQLGFDQILESGLSSDAEPKNRYYLPHDAKEDISCNIGREGDLFLNSGLNELLAAKLQRVPKVPIRIVARHPRWQRFRNELCALSLENNLYQGLTHPDLCDIHAEHPSQGSV